VRLASISLAVLAALLSGGLAQAATVTAVQGQVLVSTGQGYRLVDGSIYLGPGATVVANPGAVAHVAYGGGCTVTVQPGSVYQVAAQAPCQPGQPNQTGGLGNSGDNAGGLSGGGTNYLLLGGVAVAGAAGGYLIIQSLSP
jgi:hypothetical protein